jgi:hypothetical protein
MEHVLASRELILTRLRLNAKDVQKVVLNVLKTIIILLLVILAIMDLSKTFLELVVKRFFTVQRIV